MRPSLPILLCAFSLLPACKRSSPVTFDQHGIRVSLREIRNPEREYSTYQTRVEGMGKAYCWSNGPFGDDTARQIRKDLGAVLYLDGYLFVPVSCGGGNASKCRGYQAFATKPSLHWLGDLTGRWDGDNVTVYADGVFYDTGDMLEINDLLAHYESPRYAMAYTEAEDRLDFDAAKTWALNADAFKNAGDDAPGLLYRAGLAKLCGHPIELKTAQAIADKVLNEKGRRLFKSSLKKVDPKTVRPNPFVPANDCLSGKAA